MQVIAVMDSLDGCVFMYVGCACVCLHAYVFVHVCVFASTHKNIHEHACVLMDACFICIMF